ncbi:MAG TPA: ABC transporter permease [Bryobacteraceae bacterium]|nr:ABC transporter permease [Bryobacteraceae bacterium]
MAKRDYLATIRSKPFLFGLIVAPILFGSGFIGIAVMKAKPDIAERHIAIVDHTGASAQWIIQAAAEKNHDDLFDKVTGRQIAPRYTFETVQPDDANPLAQRLALSDRVRRHELYGFLEIGRDALHPVKVKDSEKLPEASRVDYYSNSTGIDNSRNWIGRPVDDGLREARMTQLGIGAGHFSDLLAESSMQDMGLVERDMRTGAIEKAQKRNEIATFTVPFVLMMMLAMIVLMSGGPMLGAVADDKQQRVFEMLLGSATPFELMMGKVLGAIGLTMTSSIFYIAGATLVLQSLAMIGLAPFHLLPWFFVYLIADVMVMSSLAVGVGSACASPNDAQHLAMVVMGPTLIPLFLLMPVMQAPNGGIATAMSLMPPFTPLIMMMRQAMPGGVPFWQPWAGLVGVILWTYAVTWAGARIFRIGVLMQGKTASLPEIARWAWKG